MLSPSNASSCPLCQNTANLYCSKPPARYYRCLSCDTIFQDPFPSVEAMTNYADQHYTEGLYRSYIQARELKYATFRKRIPMILQRAKGSRILDVGCSCGFFIDVALEAGLDAHGIELSSVAIAAASEKSRPRIMQGNVEAMEKQSGRYDIVTAFDIIEHTHDPIGFLRSINRILSPDGLLVLTTPNIDHFLRKLMRSRWPMLQPMQHTILFSEEAMRRVLTKAGFAGFEFLPAKKTITLDYLAEQNQTHNPLLTTIYGSVMRFMPERLRKHPVSINIGEITVLAQANSS